MTVGPIEGTAEAIALTNGELAGFPQTRLTLPVTAGDLILPVESTYGWADTGKVLVYGTVYTYAYKTLTTLEGITWTDGATVYNGARLDLVTETRVTDVSRATSDLDLLRRATLVDYAEDVDLDTVGRNLGVLRRPLISDNERFREVVRALAYNPRGTVYGIELVLTALLGVDNFEILEDVINHPNKVFIKLKGDLLQSDLSEGKAFLHQSEPRPTDSTTQVTVLETPLHVAAIQLAPEDNLTNCRVNYPSLNYLVEYEGGSPQVQWAVAGTGVSEGTEIIRNGFTESLGFYGTTLTWDGTTTVGANATSGIIPGLTWVKLDSDGQWFKVIDLVLDTSLTIENPDSLTIPTGSTNSSRTHESDGSIEFTLSPPTDYSLYAHGLRVTEEGSVAEASIVATVPTGAPNDTIITTGLQLDDGTRYGFVGIQSVTSNFNVGFATIGGSFTSSKSYARGVSVDIRLVKVRDESWELYLDGELFERITYSSATATSGSTGIAFGHFSTSAVNDLQVKQAGYKAKDSTNYWGRTGASGTAVNPDIMQLASAFIAGDVGKQMITDGGSNTENTGPFEIYQYDAANQVRVRGFLQEGTADLGVGADDRIVVDPKGQLFVYPYSIGQQITIPTSDVGNAGSYTITALLERGTLTDYDDYDTDLDNGIVEETNIAVVSGGPLAPESSVDWRLDPDFTAAFTLFSMQETGSVAAKVLTLRSPTVMPHPTVVTVRYSFVETAQLLFDAAVANGTDVYHPFYVTDVIGFLSAYLDDVTAAGVIPEYLQE